MDVFVLNFCLFYLNYQQLRLRMSSDDNVLRIFQPVFKISNLIGIFPLQFHINSKNEPKIIKNKLVFILSIIKIIIMIFYDLYYSYTVTSYYISLQSVNPDSVNIINILSVFFYHSYLIYMLVFILRCQGMFSITVEQLYDINNLIGFKYERRQQIIVSSFLFVYLMVLTVLLLDQLVDCDSINSFINSCASYFSSCNQVLLEIQLFSLLYSLYILIQQINIQIKIIPNEPILETHLHNLKFAYGIVCDLCQHVNNIYSFNILTFLCYSNLFNQSNIYQILKNIYDMNFSSTVFSYNYDSFIWLVFQNFRLVLIFWICILVHKEVSYLYAFFICIYKVFSCILFSPP
jgi:hypothetical protein